MAYCNGKHGCVFNCCGCGMVCNLPVNICTYAMYRNDEAETDFDVVKETNQPTSY